MTPEATGVFKWKDNIYLKSKKIQTKVLVMKWKEIENDFKSDDSDLCAFPRINYEVLYITQEMVFCEGRREERVKC